MAVSSQTIVGLVALAFFAIAPAWAPTWALADVAIYFTYALFAVSLAFAWGQVGLLSLGHGVYFGVGAYTMSIVTLGMVPHGSGLHSTWVGLAAAVVLSGAVTGLLGWFFFARGGLRGAFLGIVTLALAVVAERVATNIDWLGGMNGLMNVPPLNLGLNGDGRDIYDPAPLYWTMLAVLAVTLAGLLALNRATFGVVLASIRENELRAWTMGHDVRRLKILAFALSGGIAGFSGALFVAQFGFASPSLIGFGLSSDVLIWVALGGRQFLVAAALGAVALRFLEGRLSGPLGAFWPLLMGLLFMLTVLLLPNGIFGEIIVRLDRWRSDRRAFNRRRVPPGVTIPAQKP